MPIIKFLSKSAGSEPDEGRRKLGAFLVQTQFQASTQSSALFVTAAAQVRAALLPLKPPPAAAATLLPSPPSPSLRLPGPSPLATLNLYEP